MKKTITTMLVTLIIIMALIGVSAATMQNAMESFASALDGGAKSVVVESVEKETFFNGGRGEGIINEVKAEFTYIFSGEIFAKNN